jgi:hypothetical protein
MVFGPSAHRTGLMETRANPQPSPGTSARVRSIVGTRGGAS